MPARTRLANPERIHHSTHPTCLSSPFLNIGKYMDIYCDRRPVCRSKVLDRGERTEDYARAKGWHIWRGTNMGGKQQTVILCGNCVEAGRRMLKTVEALPGQYPLPMLEIRTEE